MLGEAGSVAMFPAQDCHRRILFSHLIESSTRSGMASAHRGAPCGCTEYRWEQLTSVEHVLYTAHCVRCLDPFAHLIFVVTTIGG